MLLRFYNPDTGRILLGGRNIQEFNIKNLRSHIGLVSQEPVLFAKSILENIRYGRDGATDEECIEAGRRANAEEFVDKLQDKWQTMVGPRGSRLSGGQKQRIAVARALLRNPKLLLLDEATSALDNESERVVQKALEELMVGRTSIIVAHRLSTIRYDDIVTTHTQT
jgi:ATP-binding cassette subfamily B (MDR/TAP) protein 1